MYVSSESPDAEVWFDDLSLIHSTDYVARAVDYYPFGMEMAKVDEDPDLVYRFGYQGQYAELDTTTGFNSFALRQYDARIGRFTTVDPYGQFFSPYVGMGNSPVNGVDPSGGLFGLGPAASTLAGAGIGAAVGAGIGLAFDKDNWGYYAAGGALLGGIIGFGTADFDNQVVKSPRFNFDRKSTGSFGKGSVNPTFSQSQPVGASNNLPHGSIKVGEATQGGLVRDGGVNVKIPSLQVASLGGSEVLEDVTGIFRYVNILQSVQGKYNLGIRASDIFDYTNIQKNFKPLSSWASVTWTSTLSDGTFLSVENNPSVIINRVEPYFPGGIKNGMIRTTDIRNRPLTHPYGVAIFGGEKPNYRVATILFKTELKMKIFIHTINSL